jgi:hypothetical protein
VLFSFLFNRKERKERKEFPFRVPFSFLSIRAHFFHAHVLPLLHPRSAAVALSCRRVRCRSWPQSPQVTLRSTCGYSHIVPAGQALPSNHYSTSNHYSLFIIHYYYIYIRRKIHTEHNVHCKRFNKTYNQLKISTKKNQTTSIIPIK